MSYLTYRDLPLLATAGFRYGMSGTTQFAEDRYGQEWQVQEGEENDYLLFREVYPKSTGTWVTLARDVFEDRFNIKACCGCGGCE